MVAHMLMQICAILKPFISDQFQITESLLAEYFGWWTTLNLAVTVTSESTPATLLFDTIILIPHTIMPPPCQHHCYAENGQQLTQALTAIEMAMVTTNK